MIKRLIAGVACAIVLAAPAAFAQTEASQTEASQTEVNQGEVNQAADIDRIEDYLNAITTMDSRFIQISTAGLAEGRIRLSRPRDMRIEYDPPVPILMVASGRLLMYHDSALKQTSFLPVNQTPAAFFLRDDINLGAGLAITEFTAAANTLRLSLVESAIEHQGDSHATVAADVLVEPDLCFVLRGRDGDAL